MSESNMWAKPLIEDPSSFGTPSLKVSTSSMLYGYRHVLGTSGNIRELEVDETQTFCRNLVDNLLGRPLPRNRPLARLIERHRGDSMATGYKSYFTVLQLLA